MGIRDYMSQIERLVQESERGRERLARIEK